MQGMVVEPKVVVGLDFGTSLSGFAFALRDNPDMIYTFYDWPKQCEAGVLPDCKTLTSLLYVDACNDSEETLKLREWGWPAYVQYKSSSVAESDHFEIDFASPNMRTPPKPGRSRAASAGSYFLSNFKHHLASGDSATRVPTLPRGLDAKRATADFLSQMAKLILQEMKNSFGSHTSLNDVQWCLTVPADWDDTAKQKMRDCAEMAGLVQGPLNKGDTGSPHRLKLFVEPEAASVHCQSSMNTACLRQGSKFLIVECEDNTVNFVLYEKLGSLPSVSVREVQVSTKVLCGGSWVEDELLRYLRRKICCFRRFESEHPAIVLGFLKVWEYIKYRFNGTNECERVPLDPELVEMWEMEDEGSVESYDEVYLNTDDMKSLFDPIVKRILELIEEKMVPDLTAIMVVGRFSESPYLMKRIRDTFGSRVSDILSPSKPGSAVCRGAVMLGIQSDIIVSRISKKTYGIRVARPFIAGVHSECSKVEGDSGKTYCANHIFEVFVRKGDEVRFDDCVRRVYFPTSETLDELEIVLYSSDCSNVKFISDVGSKKEGTFIVKIPTREKLGFMPKLEVSMFFGRSEIQVTAVGKNFTGEKTGMLPVKFEDSGIY